MYEELLDKLSNQNKKLKTWIKHRKNKDKKVCNRGDVGGQQDKLSSHSFEQPHTRS